MLSQLKRSLLGLAHPTGINRWVGRTRWRTDRLLVLCYHSVALSDEAEWDNRLYCTEAFLRRRLELLRDVDANVLTLTDALTRVHSGTLPPRSVVLTFDDGTVDFPQIVVPLLAQAGFPATLYPSTYYCDRNIPVWNVALRYLLWRGRNTGPLDLSDLVEGGATVDISTKEGRATALGLVLRQATSWDTERKHSLVSSIAQRVGVDFGQFLAGRQFQLMTSEEMTALPHDLVSVELHTHRHRTPNDRELFRKEIEDNREFIMARRGAQPRHFCYPSGNYRLEYLQWLREFGVDSATTCIP